MPLSWYIIQGEKDKPANRCRKWYVVVRKKGGGTRSSTFHGTKTDARKWAPTFAAQVEAETGGKTAQTMGAFMVDWGESRAKVGDLSKTSCTAVAQAVKAFSDCSAKPLSEVTRPDIEAEAARLVGRGLAAATVRTHMRWIHAACARAVEVGLIAANPVDKAIAPKPRKPDRRALGPGQLARVLALPVDDQRAFCASLMARAGLRVSEAVGVEWRDFRGGAVHVRREVTKTDAGVRRVPLDPDSLAYVERRREHLESLGVLAGSARMCCRPDGTPETAVQVRRWWGRVREGMGCGGVVLHELRHTYLTNLAQAGVHPRVMQSLAGHASIDVAMDVYTHVNDRDLDMAAEALARLRATNC